MPAHRISTADIHQVLDMVAEGEFLLHACSRLSLPYSAVWKRIHDDDALVDLYRKANEAFGDARVAKVSDEIRSEPDAKRGAVIANFERWTIESKARKGFGKSIRHEHGGEVAMNSRSEADLMVMLEQKLSTLGISVDDFKALVKRKGKPAIDIPVLAIANEQAQG